MQNNNLSIGLKTNIYQWLGSFCLHYNNIKWENKLQPLYLSEINMALPIANSHSRMLDPSWCMVRHFRNGIIHAAYILMIIKIITTLLKHKIYYNFT